MAIPTSRSKLLTPIAVATALSAGLTLLPPAVGAAEDPSCRATLQSASGLFARGDNEGAAKLLTAAQAKCPTNLQLYLMLNTVLMRVPDGKKRALEAAEHACEIAPTNMLAHFQKAMTLMTLQQGAAATKEFQRVVELDPTSYEAWLALSDLLGAQGQADASRDAANHAAQLSPSAKKSMLSSMASKDQAGNIQGVKQEVERLIADPSTSGESLLIVGEEAMKMCYFEAAATALARAAAKYSDAPQVVSLLPLALFESGKLAESAQLCKAGKGTAGSAGREALAGLNTMAAGNFEGGQILVHSATAGNGGINLLAQGYAAMQAGRYKEAIEKFNDSLAKNPDLNVAKIYVAQCNLDLCDWKEAISQARDSIKKCGGLKVRADAVELLARMRDGEDNGASIAALKNELSTIASRFPLRDQAIAAAALGELALRDKDAAGARAKFDNAVSLMPSLVQAHLGLARCALEQGDAKSAMTALDHVLAQAPGNIDALSLKGLALVQLGKMNDAQTCLEQAEKEGEFTAATNLALGQAYQKAGDNKKAVQYIKNATGSGLSGAALVKAQETLKNLGGE